MFKFYSIAIGIFLIGLPALAEQITPSTQSCLRVRTQPRYGAIRTCVRPGQKMNVLQRRGNWVKVNYGSGSGWTYAPMTRRYRSNSTVSKTSSYIAPKVSSGSCVNLRRSSRRGSSVITCVKDGTPMRVLGKSGSRYKVKVNGKVGYVYKGYARTIKAPGETNKISETAPDSLFQPQLPVAKKPKPVKKPKPAKSPIFSEGGEIQFPGKEGGKLKAKWSRDRYSRYVSQALDTVGRDLLNRTPRDIKNWCPNFKNLSREDKKQFWVYLFSSLSVFESNHRTGTSYRESFRGGCRGRVVSRGLLQLSAKSAGAYSKYGCRTRQNRRLSCSTASQLHDPKVNLTCGVAIMNTWVRRDGSIKGRGNKGGARYWSPFRKGSKRSKMQRWTRNLHVCKNGYKSKFSLGERVEQTTESVLQSIGVN